MRLLYKKFSIALIDWEDFPGQMMEFCYIPCCHVGMGDIFLQ